MVSNGADDYVGLSAAARRKGVARQTLYNWMRQGLVTRYHVNVLGVERVAVRWGEVDRVLVQDTGRRVTKLRRAQRLAPASTE